MDICFEKKFGTKSYIAIPNYSDSVESLTNKTKQKESKTFRSLFRIRNTSLFYELHKDFDVFLFRGVIQKARLVSMRL